MHKQIHVHCYYIHALYTYIYIYIENCVSMYVHSCLSIDLSIYLSVYPSINLFVCECVRVYAKLKQPVAQSSCKHQLWPHFRTTTSLLVGCAHSCDRDTVNGRL